MSHAPQIWPFFALTTAGLEQVSAREIARLPGVAAPFSTYRRISGTYAGDLRALLSLRTVDDVFLQMARWTDIGRPRSALLRLRQLVAGIDLRSAATALARLRKKGAPAAFSVTVSFVGKRNYSGAEVRNVLAAEVAQRHGWIYQPDDRLATLNVRVFMDHEETIVGVRLAQTPLHDRPYQRVHRPGALKPPVAAALASLAEVGFGCLVLDPCCGSGTVLIEAALQGASICGGDSDRLALAAARRNLAAAKIPAILQHWDARALPLPDASVDKVICNLPWGRQVALREPRQALYPQIVAEMRRVLRPAGRIVLLTDEREAMDKLELLTLQQFEISLFGQRPTISIYAHPRVE